MRPALLLSLLALLPAALNAKAPASVTILAATCDGAEHALTIPIAPAPPSRPDGQPCCAKACHTGSCRKRLQLLDLPQ